MYTGLTPFQKNVLDADVKPEISWLFDVDRDGDGGVDDFWSTKKKVVEYAQDYRAAPDGEFVEVDPNSRITITRTTATFTDITKNEEAYVYRDMGADFFSGSLEFYLDVELSSADNSGKVSVWLLANEINDAHGIDAGGGDLLAVTLMRTAGGDYKIYLDEVLAGVLVDDDYTCSVATTYYLKIVRDETVGTYGTLYCYIYSSSANRDADSPVDMLSLTLRSKKDFQYLYCVNTYNDGGVQKMTGFSENMVLRENYTFKITDFTPARMQRGRAESGLQAPSAFTFAVSNKDNTLLPTDFDGGEVLLRLRVKAQLAFEGEIGALTFSDTTPETTNEGEEQVRVWRFQIVGVDSTYQKLTFHCRDWLQKYLEGDYPNTAIVQALFVNKDDCCAGGDCAAMLEEAESGETHEHSTHAKAASFIVPLIFGRPCIPVRPVWLALANKKLYLLGPKDAITYTVYNIRTPSNWHGEPQQWSTADYTFNTASYAGEDGNDYTFGEFIVVDTTGNGTPDSNIVFGEDNTYYDIPCEYERNDTNTLTSPVDIIDYILQDWGVASSLIDATTKAAAKAVHASWGLELNVGFWQQKTRKAVLAKLLAMSHMELIVRDKIYFKIHVKDIQHSVEKEWVVKQSDRGEGTFSSKALTTPQLKDSGYVVYQEQGVCLDHMLTLPPLGAKGTTNNISSTTIRADFIQDQLNAKRLGILSLQRLLLRKSTITFTSKGKCLQIECDDMIEIRPADYGAGSGEEYEVLVDSMVINKDLSVRITATRFSAALDNWEDLAPILTALGTDGSANDRSVFRSVVGGPNVKDTSGSHIVNLVRGTIRLEAGADIYLQAVIGDQARIVFELASNYQIIMAAEFDDEILAIYPDTDSECTFYLGYDAASPYAANKRFDVIAMRSDNEIRLQGYHGALDFADVYIFTKPTYNAVRLDAQWAGGHYGRIYNYVDADESYIELLSWGNGNAAKLTIDGWNDEIISEDVIRPINANSVDLGTDAKPWKTIFYHLLTDKTCAFMGDYTVEDLYRMFKQICPTKDGTLHYSEGSGKYYPHTDFASLPDEFAWKTKEGHGVQLPAYNNKGKLIKKVKEYEEGENSGIDRTVQQDALIALVVKICDRLEKAKLL